MENHTLKFRKSVPSGEDAEFSLSLNVRVDSGWWQATQGRRKQGLRLVFQDLLQLKLVAQRVWGERRPCRHIVGSDLKAKTKVTLGKG